MWLYEGITVILRIIAIVVFGGVLAGIAVLWIRQLAAFMSEGDEENDPEDHRPIDAP